MTRLIPAARAGRRALALAATLAFAATLTAPAPAARAEEDESLKGDLVVIDGGFAQIALMALVQPQLALYAGPDNLIQDGDPAERIGVRLRRARLGVGGWAFGMFDFSLGIELADLQVDILDAWVGYRQFSVLGAVLGAHKVPFSRYALTGSDRGSLIERPMSVDAIAPYRQVGLTLEGEVGDGLAHYWLGVYNGFERHTNFHEGYVENSAFQGNRFNRVAFAGRLSLEPLGPIGEDIADLDCSSFRIAVGSSLVYNDGQTTRTTAWEADVHLKSHGFHLLAEYVADSSEPQDSPTTTATIPAKSDRFGLTTEVGYMILPGQLGAVVRAEWFDDNESQDNNGDALVLTGGVQYYWKRHHLKAALDFTHREELKGVSRDNDTLLLQVQFAL